MTEEELTACFAAFDVVREAHSSATLKYRQGGRQMQLGQHLAEALLDSHALTKYKVPLCFREIDDDLSVV